MVSQASSTGWTAIIFAVSGGGEASAARKIVDLLLSHGAHVTDKTSEGWTALHLTALLHDDGGEASALATHLLSLDARTDVQNMVPGLYFHRPKQ